MIVINNGMLDVLLQIITQYVDASLTVSLVHITALLSISLIICKQKVGYLNEYHEHMHILVRH